MSALEDCCYRCRCGREVCREGELGEHDGLCEDCRPTRCGRLGPHEPHEWSHIRTYWCVGQTTIEGGWRMVA